MSTGQLLLLTGSPGTGKTTVAPLVADHASPSACFNLDWFFAKLRQGSLPPWQPEAHQQNRVVLSAAAAALATFTAGGYFTVADGILYPFMLDLFTDACASLQVPVNYVVLRAPLAVVQDRVRTRTTEPEHLGALADEAVVADLWTKFEHDDVDNRHHVDAGEVSPAELAEAIYHRYQSGDFRL